MRAGRPSPLCAGPKGGLGDPPPPAELSGDPLDDQAARPVHPDSPQAVAAPGGQERLNGYDTEKYEVSVPRRPQHGKTDVLGGGKLGLPIKMECRERQFSLEYKSIREEKVRSGCSIAPGLKKLDSIGGFADKVGE